MSDIYYPRIAQNMGNPTRMTVDKKGLIAMIGEENAEALIKEAEKKTLCGAVLLPQGAGYQMLKKCRRFKEPGKNLCKYHETIRRKQVECVQGHEDERRQPAKEVQVNPARMMSPLMDSLLSSARRRKTRDGAGAAKTRAKQKNRKKPSHMRARG
jgi:hypothetical protein